MATILLFAIVGQTFSQGWYYLDYIIQKNQYIQRCENKARPQLHCDGKCQLMKKIQQQEEQQRGLPPELKLVKAEVLSSKSFFAEACISNVSLMSPQFYYHAVGEPIDRSYSQFRPPSFA